MWLSSALLIGRERRPWTILAPMITWSALTPLGCRKLPIPLTISLILSLSFTLLSHIFPCSSSTASWFSWVLLTLLSSLPTPWLCLVSPIFRKEKKMKIFSGCLCFLFNLIAKFFWFCLVWNCEGRKSITGSFIGSMKETEEVLEFCKEKGVTSMIEMVKMDYVNTAFERLEKNDVRYRFVVDVAGSKLDQWNITLLENGSQNASLSVCF